MQLGPISLMRLRHNPILLDQIPHLILIIPLQGLNIPLMQMRHLDLQQLDLLLILQLNLLQLLLELVQQVVEAVLLCLEGLLLFVDYLVETLDLVGLFDAEEDNFLALFFEQGALGGYDDWHVLLLELGHFL